MRRSRTAPSRASKPASAPSTDASIQEESPPQAPPDAAPAGAPPPALGPWLQSAEGVRAFHDAARAALLDLAAAAREGARRPRKRVLSRAEIRRQARDGYAQLASLIDQAAEALARVASGGAEMCPSPPASKGEEP